MPSLTFLSVFRLLFCVLGGMLSCPCGWGVVFAECESDGCVCDC
jgi:hypothetical protein